MRKTQVVVAFSTTEFEYMEVIHTSKEEVWLQRLCLSTGFVPKFVRLDCNTQNAIFLEKNHAYHDKIKHIDVQCHFAIDMVKYKKVLLNKANTLKNVVDSLTKIFSIEKFSWCRESMGIDAMNL